MRATQPSMTNNENSPRDGTLGWLKRLGTIGFLFFLIKGLLWLILPFLLVQYGIKF
jgi:hypothetical protein